MYFLSILVTAVYAGTMPPIKVTAKSTDRNPDSVQRNVLTSESLRNKQYDTLDGALNSLPSMVVVQPGNMGQPSSLFMRGTNSNHVQIRLDGMRINSPDASNGSIDTGLVTPDSVATISLLRGGQGSLYGPDAVGGVLLFTTPKAMTTQETIVVEGGSNHMGRFSGNASTVTQESGIYLGVNGIRNSGYVQTPIAFRQKGGHYPRLYYRQNGLVGRVDHQFNDKVNLMMVSRYSEADTLIQLSNRAAPQERMNLLQRLQLGINPSENWSHQLGGGLFQSRQKNAIRDSLESKTEGQRIQMEWTQTYRSRFGDFSSVIDGARDDAQQKDRNLSMSFHQDSLGVGGVWIKKFSIVELDASLRRDKIEGFNPALTHREGAVLKVAQCTKIKTSYGTSFKTPTLYQLHAKTPYYRGNPMLKPEHSKQWEVSFDQMFGQNLRWEETYFVNNLTRLIYPTPDFTSNTNLGKVRIKGVESGLTWVDSTWQVSISHTFMKAEDRLNRTLLLRRPQTKLFSEIAYLVDQWRTSLEITRLGHRPDLHPITFVKAKAKPYMIMTIKTQKKLESGLHIFGRIENLLNRKIQEPLGYRKAGIAVYLGLEAKIA